MARGKPQSYPTDTTGVAAASGSHPEPQIEYGTTPFGAPVARPSRVQPAWLTPVEVAAHLKVSRATVYFLLKSGALPHRRIGLSIRIAHADFEAYLRHH